MIVKSMLRQHAHDLEILQRIVFPTLAAEEHIRAEQYLHHLEIFPEGQFVLMDDDRIVGMTTTMRCDFDLEQVNHTFSGTSGGGWLSNHQPDGEWLYGLDMGIDPAYRGRGGARLLYRTRQQLARRLGLLGQLTVGMMNGYGKMSGQLSGDDYYRQWKEGSREDPTLTPQRRIGFRPLALIPGYLHDPGCGDFGVLLRLDIGQEV